MNDRDDDRYWMEHALALAAQGAAAGEVPVGCVVVHEGIAVGEGWNRPIGSHDPSAHAEVVALRAAAAHLGNYRLVDTTLYVTLEPCVMCIGAIVHARVGRLVYGAPDPKTGAVESAFRLLDGDLHNHRVEVTGGLLADASGELLRDFFRVRRFKTPKE
ncbi:MAG: tRNA adenosine(34) deaminase TadA [Gammaproteobacteria bacterium]|jgi:tRNA(adenine34) deaminase|nr:tRNA adenosine(34) deaminase TadA [Gammaproteobacteria bacterium]